MQSEESHVLTDGVSKEETTEETMKKSQRADRKKKKLVVAEEDKLELATSLLAKAKAKGVSLLLPTDVVVADKFAPDANSKIVSAAGIEDDGWD
ncbi:hypothetical protein HA466_0165900 [Hirschfeldia incana]|nr:hypothetical protein HA466_0165900 [Hirschfeldia incana]KAJ0247139.1 hypothetical protein HA466_0165900 [Hirschfeldia incana]KAJ0247140.1 hypothetical protein HA466_0165900 [Hirschfeldia incana]